MSKPVVREYVNDEELKSDIEDLQNRGLDKDDIYVISHDDDRTNRVADSVDANTVGLKEMGIENAVGKMFNKKGDELRAKFKEMGFSQEEANQYEDKLDKGRILMMVTDVEKVNDWS
ncbi:general stress protein [Pseudalkalibacillus sp. SCS-8]|uniref:general stress protein n=1 Tax=Pseudalkalibacillus nanhaiensis TaxID=3115291 RepID=UPI0032DBC969